VSLSVYNYDKGHHPASRPVKPNQISMDEIQNINLKELLTETEEVAAEFAI
jgi:hypothetical protein